MPEEKLKFEPQSADEKQKRVDLVTGTVDEDLLQRYTDVESECSGFGYACDLKEAPCVDCKKNFPNEFNTCEPLAQALKKAGYEWDDDKGATLPDQKTEAVSKKAVSKSDAEKNINKKGTEDMPVKKATKKKAVAKKAIPVKAKAKPAAKKKAAPAKAKPAVAPKKVVAKKTEPVKKPVAKKKSESRITMIADLIMEGSYTKKQMYAMVIKKYPDRKENDSRALVDSRVRFSILLGAAEFDEKNIVKFLG